MSVLPIARHWMGTDITSDGSRHYIMRQPAVSYGLDRVGGLLDTDPRLIYNRTSFSLQT